MEFAEEDGEDISNSSTPAAGDYIPAEPLSLENTNDKSVVSWLLAQDEAQFSNQLFSELELATPTEGSEAGVYASHELQSGSSFDRFPFNTSSHPSLPRINA